MFKFMWSLKVKYLEKKWKYYVWKGDIVKANETFKEVMKMLATYTDAFLKPAFEKLEES